MEGVVAAVVRPASQRSTLSSSHADVLDVSFNGGGRPAFFIRR